MLLDIYSVFRFFFKLYSCSHLFHACYDSACGAFLGVPVGLCVVFASLLNFQEPKKKKKWEQRAVLGGSGLVRTWAPISCGVHSALAYIDIHIYIYMFIFILLLAAICACPPVFFFFFRLENDCDWISMESNPLDGKKKNERVHEILFF